MDLVQINDFETIMVEYAKAMIKGAYPNTDVSDGSPIHELIAKPFSSIGRQLAEHSTQIELRSNLMNAASMTEEDMDDIGEGNYMMERKAGAKSTGVATFKFKSVSETQSMVIPSGSIVSTKAGLKFLVDETHTFTPEEMYAKWDPASLTYNVDIAVSAEDTGTKYDVDAGSVIVVDSKFTSYDTAVSNNQAMSGGSDKESNTQYADRILKYLSSRTLETSPGYEQDIKENFPEVSEVYVAGYGDPLMKRDKAQTITMNGVTFLNRSIGGKTDIYVRGGNIKLDKVTLQAKNKTIKIQEANNLAVTIDPVSVVVTNISSSFVLVKDTHYTVSFPAAGTTLPNTLAVIDIIGAVSYGNQVKIDYLSGSPTPTIPASKTVTVDMSTIDLPHYFNTAEFGRAVINDVDMPVTIKNETTGLSVSLSDFFDIGAILPLGLESPEFPYPGYPAGIPEDFFSRNKMMMGIEALTSPVISNGDNVSVTYSYNDTLERMETYYIEDEHRVVTRDIYCRECTPIQFFIKVSIRLKEGVVSSSSTDSAITKAIAEFMDSKILGSKIDQSDLINFIYTNSATMNIVDYFEGKGFTVFAAYDPTQAGTIPETMAEVIADLTPNEAPSTWQLNGTSYPVVNKLEIVYISTSPSNPVGGGV